MSFMQDKSKPPLRTRFFGAFLLLASFIAVIAVVIPATGGIGKSFSVKDFSPEGVVKGSSVIKVSFSSEVVDSSTVGRRLNADEMPVQISPQLSGMGKWQDPSTFIFYPATGYLAPATSYRVTISKNLSNLQGEKLRGRTEFSMRTAPLKFVDIKQTDFSVADKYVEYTVEFSLPVSASMLKGFLSFKDKNGKPVECYIPDSGVASSIAVRTSIGDGSPITMLLAKGFTPAEGSLGTERAETQKIERTSSTRVSYSNAFSEDGSCYINIETSTPLDSEKASSFIELTPPCNFTVESYGSSLRINTESKPRERITVRLRKGMPTRDGQPFESDWVRSFIFPDMSASLRLLDKGRVVSPASAALLLPFTSINVDRATVTVKRVYDNNVSFVTLGDWPYYVTDLSAPIYEKSFALPAKPNEKATHSIDLGKIIGKSKGLFEVLISHNDGWPELYKIVNVTDIGCSVKLSENGALVWANSISEGKPAKGVKVEFYSRSNQILAEGTTDSNGVALIKQNQPWSKSAMPDLAIFRKDDDTAVLRLDQNIWQEGSEEFAGKPYTNKGYQALCYTTRGVFRPGERVPVQVLVRDKNMTFGEAFPVLLKVITSAGFEWKKSTLKLSANGMASSIIQLSDAAPTGPWTADVYIAGEEEPIGSTSFLVEDFAPPRITATLNSDKKEITKSDQINLRVASQYLFGGAADGLAYEAEMTFIPREYSNPKWSGYIFADKRVKYDAQVVSLGDGVLSEEGVADIPITIDEQMPPSVLDVAVRVGIMEDSGRWFYRTLTLPYYPNPLLLGIRTPKGEVTAKTKTPFSFAAITSSGAPSNLDSITLSVYKVSYTRITSRSESGGDTSELKQELTPMSEYQGGRVQLSGGVGAADILFPTGGEYLILAEDKQSGVAASVNVYAYDSSWSTGDAAVLPENLNITLDKKLYLPGDKATARISGSFAGRVLLTIEKGDVIQHETMDIAKDGGTFSFKVTEEMMPNAWVTAHLIRPAKAEENWSSHRAFGAVPLAVDCSSKKLEVKLIESEKLQPRAKNNFSVQLTGANGKPAEGEVLLMLVDEGILSLTRYSTPSPYDLFTSRRALSIRAYDMYDELLPLYLKPHPILTPGGDGGDDVQASIEMAKASLSPVKASRFKPLALWKKVPTDKNGRADFSFVLPEFSGSVRLMAVAAAKGSSGSGEKLLIVARDVVTEHELPRALAPTDTFDSFAQVFNKSTTQQDVTLTFNISGPLAFTSINNSPLGGASKEAQVKLSLTPGSKSRSVPITIKGEGEAGLAKVTVKTNYSGKEYTQTTEIPVRPPYPRSTQSGFLSLAGGASQKLSIPGNWMPGTRRAVLSMSGMPTVGLSDAAIFLVEYPYHCLEQTVSSAWALLAQPNLVKTLDPSLSSPRQLALAIGDRIRRIQSLQLYNGSFSAWPGSGTADWETVYATHFLVECEKRGVPIPKETLKNALGYLNTLISSSPANANKAQFGGELSLRSYACYVVGLKSKAPLSWMSYLNDNIGKIPGYGRTMLAAAYARAGDKNTARGMLGENVPSVASYGLNTQEKQNLDSDIRSQALYLLAWNEIDPTSGNAAAAAAALMNSLRSTKYLTTQEAGFSFASLGTFYSFNSKGGAADLIAKDDKQSVILKASGESAASVILKASGESAAKVNIDETIKQLSIENAGKGTGFASWTVDGVSLVAPKPEDIGVRVRVSYSDSSGAPIAPGSTVRKGRRITGTITLVPLTGSTKNIVVTLPLSGGLEIENPRLMDPADESEENDQARTVTERSELRDDRLLIFVDDLSKKREWSFSMRAVTQGHFVLPPIAAVGMYSPGTRSITSASSITVTAP